MNDIIDILYLWPATLSAISSTGIIVYIFKTRCNNWKISQNLTKVYLNIAISDLLFSLTMIPSYQLQHTFCIFLASMNQLGGIVTLLWVFWSGKFLHDVICTNTDASSINMYKPTTIIWSISFIAFTIPPFINYPFPDNISYGDSGGHCWILSERIIDQIWRYVMFYIPLWITIGYLLWIYYKIYNKFKNVQSQYKKNILLKMGMFPAILIICFLAASIRRIWELLYFMNILHSPASMEMIAIQAGTMNWIGLFDAVVMFCMLNKCGCNDNANYAMNDNNDNDSTNGENTSSPNHQTDSHQLLQHQESTGDIRSDVINTSTSSNVQRCPQLNIKEQERASLNVNIILDRAVNFN